MTTIDGIVAGIRSGMSVYIPMIAFGNRQKIRAQPKTTAYDSFIIRFISDMTLSSLPAPMILLTKVLHVEEKAASIIHNRPDIARTIFDIARGRSPRCSIYRKNISHVNMDTTCWIIVHEHTGSIDLISFQSNLAGLSKAYFWRSQFNLV